MATTVPEEAERYIGRGVHRKEDPKLVTGQGQFIESINVPGMLWMSLVRCPMAHARIGGIDTSAAKDVPGVVDVVTAEDLTDEWAAPLPMAWPVTEDIKHPDHWPLARGKARYAGDAVAAVIATSREAALDACELVEVEYDPLASVTDAEAALADDAPVVHDEFGTNTCYVWPLQNGDVDTAFSGAAVTVSERYRNQRLIPNAIEPRGAVCMPVAAMGEYTLWSSTQIPHILKATLAQVTGVPESKLRVIAPDVGGGFGSKLNVYAEEALCLALARRLGKPVKWIEERSENYLSTIHGRDQVQEVELAANDDGTLRGIRVNLVANMGAYLQLVTPGIPILGALLYCGVYKADAYDFRCTGVFTNTVPTDAYRGAGRPEASYAIERAMDALAREVGVDPVEIRRRNFLPKGELVETPATLQYDSTDYEAALDRALELAGYDDIRREQSERRERGDPVRLGIGLSTYVEICGLAPSQVLSQLRYSAGGWDTATIRLLPTGKVECVTGTSPHGQGHETSWSQIVADALGVPYEDVTVLHGDTAVSPYGMDTYGSRSLAVGGIAVHLACERVVEKAKRIAAHQLECAPEDLEFAQGAFRVKGAPDRTKAIQEMAFEAWTAHNLPEGEEPVLEATYAFDPPNFTFPFGTHVCVAEVDVETGHVAIRSYVAVDDCGNVINPTIVDGQVHGGIAQGLGQALYEEAVYDPDGNLVTSSMLNYLVPSAAEIPHFTLDRTVTPSPTNPLGVKGVGEAGTIAAPQAVVNAVIDALAPDGVRHIDMPVSPENVWRAIQEAQS